MKSKSVKKLENMALSKTTPLRRFIWSVRRFVRDLHPQKIDVLNVHDRPTKMTRTARKAYKTLDSFMAKFFPGLQKTTSKKVAVKWLRDMIGELEYTIVEEDTRKPWGAYFRMANEDVERFIKEFFPGLTLDEARMGHDDVVLSPKFLLVSPGQRLSWQFHHRRAERWRFLSDGAYFGSMTDKQGKRVNAPAGTVVQLEQAQRHRLCAANEETYTLVAEIWQHTDPNHSSEEADIVRLKDDYDRV